MKTQRTILGAVLVAALCFLWSGCGPYKIRYVQPSKVKSGLTTTQTHVHGLGLLGGGGYFFAVHQMFPALVDYTGPVDVKKVCPNDFAEISHAHSFGQNAGAAFLSWLVFVNVYHESNVTFEHAGGLSRRS